MKSEHAVMLDVRTKKEYNNCHIEGSINIPLKNIGKIKDIILDKETEILVCCSKARASASAVKHLKKEGYLNVTDIGGIDFSFKNKRSGRIC